MGNRRILLGTNEPGIKLNLPNSARELIPATLEPRGVASGWRYDDFLTEKSLFHRVGVHNGANIRL